ncbi:YdeI/OmpD-associated family protein [Terriglobus aquaticus]|uniref:YdeI/OmpD-associated family protein n=1 Tax=Terriglobus aquaticus TaxID=940139 RepID=A0ABW9KFS3_9BACT|nr:YdeI/OmpD-associated family protein [Terriglobus aquaticus]
MATARATNTDARIDAKIAAASSDIQPVLEYLRDLVHEAVPEATETIKWSHPFFELDGVIFAMMGIFKNHCSFGFWSRTMTEHLRAEGVEPMEGAGSFGRITRIKDLPARKKMLGYLKTAADHIRKGIAESPMGVRRSRRGPDGAVSSKTTVPIPPVFAQALQDNPTAKQNFEAFPPSCRREYVLWITQAKREETRVRRVQQAVAQLQEGKRFNWKYEAKS